MSKIDEAIELLKKAHLNIPDGITKAQDAICAAIDILESLKTEQPPAGEFTKNIRDRLNDPKYLRIGFLYANSKPLFEACDLIDAQQQEIELLKRYAAGIETDGTEPYKDMVMDIGAAFGNRANNASISDADLLRQIYETLEGKP